MNTKEEVFTQPAFILHHRVYRNTSLIIDVFSRDYGRLSLVAKGVKRKKSPLKGVLQSFQPLNLSWVRRTELGTLVDAELQNPIIQLAHENLYSGLYVNEIISRLLPTFDSVPELFQTYFETLYVLSKNERNVTVALRLFEKQLLASLGYEIPLLEEIVHDSPIQKSKYYEYLPEQGFIESEVNMLSKMQFKGEHLLALSANQLDSEEILKTAHRLMHINLKRLLGDEPLKSRELYRSYKSMMSSPD